MERKILLHPAATLVVAPLVDPIVEERGFGPTSSYVEFCWLPVLGPTTTWLYRRLAMPLLAVGEFEVDVTDLSVSLGLGEGLGRNSPVMRSFGRLVKFGAADWGGTRLLVRRALAPLTVLQASRLSWSARQHHEMVATYGERRD